MAALTPGTVLGARFQLLGELGRGGMATVWLAQDEQRGEKVALKLLHGHLVQDASARRRLQREIAAAARLEHEGLLLARELLELDGQLGLVLPLHPGHTLSEEVRLHGALPPDQVRRLGLRLAEALGSAHRAGLLHRDLSGRNVMVDARGAPVLTDFGLARLQEGGTGGSTALIGTTGFVAPEVLAGQPADPRSDLYGLGAVMYLAATGREPFAAAHPSAVLHKQLAGEVRPIRDQVVDFPPWLEALILALLDPDPARRPAGTADLGALLEEGQAPRPSVPAAPPPTPAGPPLAARLTPGHFTVVVRLPEERRKALKARRAIQRRAQQRRTGQRHGDLVDLVDQVSEVIEDVAGWREQGSLEDQLAARVAAAAELPEGALRPATALSADAFQLVRQVDRATAERLAEDARQLGLRARVHPDGPGGGPGAWLMERWWALIPLMWIAYPGLMVAGAPDWTVFVVLAATVFLGTVVGPWVKGRVLPSQARRLPLAYAADLRPLLQPELQARAAEGIPALAPAASPTASEPSQLDRVLAQARAALDELEAALVSQPLPDVVLAELRASAAQLRAEVEGLARDLRDLEASLTAADRPDEGAWAAERLSRLSTLARAGQAVDPQELSRLEAAVRASQAAQAAEAAVESRRTADLARLLEIAATAHRLHRELQLDGAPARRPEEALADLQRRAAAAARARRELG